ncbi:MAG: ribonuclease III [Propionibacteriaceae bacterium]|nr:ribonuclease III [Propionibacteriaceae bacterium]
MSRIDKELAALGVAVDPQWFELALTHRSWAYENGGGPTNERLEFLGDAVLGVVVTELVFRSYPDRPEGQLARLRAAVVSGHALAGLARALELGPLVKLGKGEVATCGGDKDSILADTVEAVIGAVHLTGGFDASGRLVRAWFAPRIEEAAELGAGLDWKSSLQELTAALGLGAPSYSDTASGPDHDRRYLATVTVAGQGFGPGGGSNKRRAEQEAARLAYGRLRPADPASSAPAAAGSGAPGSDFPGSGAPGSAGPAPAAR